MTISAVETTGIFCRSSCAARPRPDHVTAMSGVRDALFAGFRPCRRCHPIAGDEDPAWAAAAVAAVESDPEARRQVWQLAAAAGIGAAQLERWMEGRHRMSVAAYLRARRLTQHLRSARVARQPRAGHGRVVTTLVETPLGPMLAGATDEGICLLEFTDRPMLPTEVAALTRLRGPLVGGRHPHLDALRNQLGEYFAGVRSRFDVPLDAPGSPFQGRVWAGLRQIPFGETRTYAQLAAGTGRRGAARAVGRANGSNRVSIVIPCHRVVATGGGLGGYGGGLDRKRQLLELEASARGAQAGGAPGAGPVVTA